MFANNTLYVAHDGGIDIATNFAATGNITWQQKFEGLGITQLYHFSNSRQNPTNVIVGTQDLGTRMLKKD